MKHYTVDIPVKMTKIKAFLDTAVAGGADVEEVVRSLEELVEIVENLDFASDYNRIGGLPALMALLKSPHASVRAGAAEVIATSAQNHDRVQGEMLAAGVMGVLVSLFGDEDPVVVAKALLAVGSLVRGNDAGVAAFKAAQGPTELWGLLGHQDVRVRRKALQVLQGLLKADHDSRLMAAERGAANQLAQVLSEELAGGSADMPRVHMALEALFALARDPGARASVVGAATLPGTLRDWERRLAGMPLEDRDALREESVLIKLLSRVCAGDGAG